MERDLMEHEREPVDAKAWLWRLECIEKQLAEDIRGRDLHIGFTIKLECTGSSREIIDV
jgi:hypothetical protein